MCAKSRLTFELGTKIFAYINLVLVLLSSTVTYGVTIIYILLLITYRIFDIYSATFLALLLLAPTIALIFAVILFVGVKNEKPQFLCAYIIYGIVVILLGTVGSLLLTFVPSKCFVLYEYVCAYPPTFAGVLLVCVIYSLIVFMVGKTYCKFKEARHRELKYFTPEINFQEKKGLV